MRNPGHQLRAVTLIELCVVLAVLVVLVAILIPVLAGTRRRATESESLANLRSHTQVFAMYTGDWREFWPYFTRPGPEGWEVRGAGMVLPEQLYFDAHALWHIALADLYFEGTIMRHTALFPPGYRDGNTQWPLRTGYHYACAFIAEPAYWSQETRTGIDQMKPTTVSQVSFPAHKSLIIEAWPFSQLVDVAARQQSVTLPVGAVDGSAHSLPWQLRAAGVPTGDGHGFQLEGAVHYHDWPPLMHTVDGVRGRDIKH